MEKDVKKKSHKNVLHGNSYVNKYDLLKIEEKDKTSLSEEHIGLAFQALDGLIPLLGVYTPIFAKLRKDLFDAVYSEELTSSSHETADSSDCGSIQRKPYFVLVHQVYGERHKQTEELNEQLETVKKRLFDKHKQLEDLNKTLNEKDESFSDLKRDNDELNLVIEEKEKEINDLEKELDRVNTFSKNNEYQLECDITDLKESLEDAKSEINYLSQFKKGYDDLYYAFLDKIDAFDQPRSNKKPVISTKRSNLLSEIEAAQKLEEQLLTVVNTAIEEYDKYVESHKENLQTKVIDEEMTDAELDVQELEIEEADQELEAVQLRFQATMLSLTTELELMRHHSTMLLEQLQLVEESKPNVKPKDKRSSIKENSKLSFGLEANDKLDEISDPFIPQERVFSKYAAMLYTSNNRGKTFEEFKEAKYCASCGEKTVICPHKLGGSDRVFILPHNCSHLKITRPKVRISKEMKQEVLRLDSPETTMASDMISPDSRLHAGTVSSLYSLSADHKESNNVHSLHRLWDDFKQRTNIERVVPRKLSKERTRSVVEQFFTYLIWSDEYMDDAEACTSILDLLYNFMHDRYLVDDASFMSAHDFILAIIEFSRSHKMLELLGNVLVGNLDASTLRYILLICDFIDVVDWKEVEDFRAFSSVIYPFLNEDDIETLQMSYTSYSENKISANLVASFFIHLILKQREPRFQELEKDLVPFQSGESRQMNDKEFKEALDSVVPLRNERARRRLYKQAEESVKWDDIHDAVPLVKLSQISSFLALQQITTIVKENVSMKVAEWRDRPTSGESGGNRPFAEALSEADDELFTLSAIKQMVFNMNRQNKHRNKRKTDDSDEDDNEEAESLDAV